MLWALTWSLSACGSPHRYFLSGVNVVIVLALVILYYYFKKHLSNNHQGTLKKKKKKKALVYCSEPGGYKACLGPHSEVTGRQRENLGFCLYYGQGWDT